MLNENVENRQTWHVYLVCRSCILTWKFMIASEILMLIGSMTMTMLNGTSSRSATFSICATKASHSTSSSMYCCRHDFIRFTQYCSHGFSVWPMQAPHVVIFVNWAVHSLSGRRFVIAFATSAAEESASLKTRVAMKDRFTWPESLSGTSPNGFNSFMYLLTQSRYLWVRREGGNEGMRISQNKNKYIYMGKLLNAIQ